MKTIKYKDFNSSYGILYDLEDPIKYKQDHLYEAVNVPFEKLIANYKKILDKNQKYYLYCRKGLKSKKAAHILEYYGYDVTLVINE